MSCKNATPSQRRSGEHHRFADRELERFKGSKLDFELLIWPPRRPRLPTVCVSPADTQPRLEEPVHLLSFEGDGVRSTRLNSQRRQ